MFNQLPELQERAETLRPVALKDRQPFARPASEVSSEEVDAVLDGSFPASDPPSWTSGIARPAPERAVTAEGADMLRRAAACF